MELKRLAPQFRTVVTADFLAGKAGLDLDLEPHIEPFHRLAELKAPDTEHVANVASKAMEKFSANKREESDRWLAPRVHATLRLTRREAGDPGVWNCLAVTVLEEYVRWRWQ